MKYESLEKKYEDVLPAKAESPLKCINCDEEFGRRIDLQMHIKRQNSMNFFVSMMDATKYLMRNGN